jgi:Cu/Ag efflux pump CusA
MNPLAAATRWSLDQPRLIAWSCLLGFCVGLIFLGDLKIALLPPIAPAVATVHTEAPGLVAEQVEQLVTRPVETALAGAVGVDHVHSESVQGLSVVTLTAKPGVDARQLRQAMLENLAGLGGLPAGVGAPRLSPLSQSGGDLMQIGFTSARLDPMGLRDLIQWTVRPRLSSIPGVANVAVFGGQTRRLEIRARPGDLSDSDLGFLDIVSAVRRATGVTGAGFIDTPSQRVLIDPHGQALTPDDVGAGQIQTAGAAPVRINDVADVFEAPAPAFGDALINGRPGVLVSIAAQYDANAVELSHRLDQALQDLEPAMTAAGIRVDANLDRPADFAASAVRGVVADLAIGALLILAALFVYLRDPRAVLVSAAGVPLCFLLSILTFTALGWSINAMTLGGLALALGVVIDDAVIDVDNVLVKFRDEHHTTPARAILAACLEVRGPVVYATLAVIAALLPLAALPGPSGAMLGQLAGAAIIACLISLLVAALVTPALCWIFLRSKVSTRRTGADTRPPPGWLDRLQRAGPAGLLGCVALAAVSLAAIALARPDVFPSFHAGRLELVVDAPPSTSLNTMRNYGIAITRALAPIRGVASISEVTGRDPTSETSAGPEHSRFEIGLAHNLDDHRQQDIVTEILRRMRSYAGLHAMLRSTFEPAFLGAPDRAFTVTIYGGDLDTLDRAAGDVAEALKTVPGGSGVFVEGGARAPVVRVDLNFQRLAIFGLSAADVLDTIQAAFAGAEVAQVYRQNRPVDLAVIGQDSLRRDPEDVGELLLRSTSGVSTPLKNVSNIYLTEGRPSIAHDGGLRRVVVRAGLQRGDPETFARDAHAAISSKVKLPPGAFVEYDQPGATAAIARRNIAIDYAVSLLAVFALLAISLDGRSAAIILGFSLFSFVGAAAAIWMLGGVLSLGAIAALIALLGVSMRGAILVITCLEDLILVHNLDFSLDAVRRASRERSTPMLVSSALIALGLGPLAFHAGEGGREVLGPFAIVTICGLISSAAAGVVVLPPLLFAVWRPSIARRARHSRTGGGTGAHVQLESNP